MFVLQENPIDTAKAKSSQGQPQNGAMTSFEGMIRNDQNNDKVVAALLYVADNAACIAEGEKIMAEARAKFSLTDAVCIQRIGQVKVGETAIWIGVWSGHRDEAFQGCRYIIEEVKKRLLVWKKEVYTDGTSQWIHGTETPAIS
jgi:molybdopterin synthase catalytic subunit